MNGIMAVRCPACDQRVEGSSSEDLSRSIRSHFADVHKMDIDVEMNVSDEGCGCGTERSIESSSAQTVREQPSGGMFECPVCREEMTGSSEDDMSARFREHLATTHKDEPLVTQLMETVGRQ